MKNIKNFFYIPLISLPLLLNQAKAEQVFYPPKLSEGKTEEISQEILKIKNHYDSLEKTIFNYADVLKNPIGEIKAGRTKKGYPILLSNTETNEDKTKNYDEKQGTFRVVVILPKKESGINVRYHPKDNESDVLVVKFKSKTREFESATFLRKENGKEKEQREIINEGKGIYSIIDSVFEENKEKILIKRDILGRIVGNLTDNLDIQPYIKLTDEYMINYSIKLKK